jgi:hypothetical protein
MGAALTIFVVMSFSVLVVRVASVALQQTGMNEATARFQALSVFTGCGFTTSESETIVNYPVRRKIAAVLMIIGNLGLIGVLSTLVVSLVGTDGSAGALLKQVVWLLGGSLALWLLMFNKTVDRYMCARIGDILTKTTSLGKRDLHRLLQINDGNSISEHFLTELHIKQLTSPDFLETLGLKLLAVERLSGEVDVTDIVPSDLDVGDRLLVLGVEDGHEGFGR